MKIKFKENGAERELEVSRVVITDKDGFDYRISQDYVRGIEVLGDGIDGKMYIEPHTSNQVTILTTERL